MLRHLLRHQNINTYILSELKSSNKIQHNKITCVRTLSMFQNYKYDNKNVQVQPVGMNKNNNLYSKNIGVRSITYRESNRLGSELEGIGGLFAIIAMLAFSPILVPLYILRGMDAYNNNLINLNISDMTEEIVIDRLSVNFHAELKRVPLELQTGKVFSRSLELAIENSLAINKELLYLLPKNEFTQELWDNLKTMLKLNGENNIYSNNCKVIANYVNQNPLDLYISNEIEHLCYHVINDNE